MTSATTPPEQSRIEAQVLGTDTGNDPFVAAVRATRMPMIITDPRQPDNPVVFVNNAFVTLTGYERSEILGRNCRFLQGDHTDPEVRGRIGAAVRARESIEIEIRNYRKDGTAFWNKLLLAPVWDSAGELAYFFASQMDVTLERERLAALESDNAALVTELSHRIQLAQDSEARLRFASMAGQLGIWELDLTSRDLVTSAFCRLHFGLPADEAMSFDAMADAVHPGDQARFRSTIGTDADGRQERGGEFRLRPKDGRVRWIELRAQLRPDGVGDRRVLAGVTSDVTGRKLAETRRQALIDLDDRLRETSSAEALVYASAESLGRTLDVGRAGYGSVDGETELLRIDRQWHAPDLPDLATPLDIRQFGSFIDDMKRGDTVVVDDAGLDPRTTGTAALIASVDARSFVNVPVMELGRLVSMLFVADGQPRTWSEEELAFIREVAHRTRMAVERRRAEDDLRSLAASLEEQVADRSDALMQAEASLRQSQKMEAVGQLTGGIAHDFNNLLTGISGSLDLLKTRLAQGRLADVERYVAAAQMASQRAAALTHRLLAFSRRQTLEPRVSEVNRLVGGMEELIRRTVGPAVQLEVVGAGGLWNVLVDPGQLENALLNLCINARDAMPDGGRLTVETANRSLDDHAARRRDMPAGQYVSLCVSDNGVGMTPDVIAKAFDPFFTTKPIGQGTGLGLSMIYGFVRQSGGQAQIFSEPGSGTSVWLYLPRHRGPADQPDGTGTGQEEGPATRGETVLVVDDEPTVRMLVVDVLRDAGLHCLEAGDGPAALCVLRSDARIDLLVTDVGLPGGMNGRQVADAARALRPGLRVLFITGYAENAVLGHGHLDPGMHVMTKPFATAALAARVRGLLARD